MRRSGCVQCIDTAGGGRVGFNRSGRARSASALRSSARTTKSGAANVAAPEESVTRNARLLVRARAAVPTTSSTSC